MLNKYELMVIIKADITADGQKKIFSQLEKSLVSGKIKETKDLGKRKLAYKIGKEKEGNYYLINLETESHAVKKMTEFMRLNSEILRYLVVRV